MGLLIVLFVFAGDTLYLYRSNRETKRNRAGENAKLEREITTVRQQDAAFQSYLDPMAGLLQEKNLRTSDNEEVRNVAKTQTLSVLDG
jgi:hypothetical protein